MLWSTWFRRRSLHNDMRRFGETNNFVSSGRVSKPSSNRLQFQCQARPLPACRYDHEGCCREEHCICFPRWLTSMNHYIQDQIASHIDEELSCESW